MGGAVAAGEGEDLAVLDLKGEREAEAEMGDQVTAGGAGLAVEELASSTRVDGISAPVGQACTHSPQATQVEAPIGSSKSNTIFSVWPRPAMPMTSLTCTSRQARTHRLQWMQASRLTAMAGWLRSGSGAPRRGKGLVSTFWRVAVFQNSESGSCAMSCAGWSAMSSSTTMRRAVLARSVWVFTFMPGVGLRMQLAASTRSPSIST